MTRRVSTGLCLALLLTLLVAFGCKSKPDIVYKRGGFLSEEVAGTGYAWGDKAEEVAKKLAVAEVSAKALPRAMEFTWLKVDSYVMFKTKLLERPQVTIEKTEKLPDGGVMVVAKATRGSQSMRKMRHMQTANFQLVCKGDSFKERYDLCEEKIYSTSLEAYAMRNYNKIPDKMRGNFTFFDITRTDDGKKMRVEVVVFVGMGSGQITPRETGMVLMNAWRQAVAAGKGEQSVELFKRAMKAFPNANYAEEFALYEGSRKHWNNAIWAVRQAIKVNQYEVRYYKLLYQLYKNKGDQAMMAKTQKELEEMEAWEEDGGTDIGSSITYSTEIRWTNPGGQTDEDGTVRFRDASDNDD